MRLREPLQSWERRELLRQFFEHRVRLRDVPFTIGECHLIGRLKGTYRTRHSRDRRKEINLLQGKHMLCSPIDHREGEILDTNVKGEDSLHGYYGIALYV